MKKKLALIGLSLLVCFGLIFGAKQLQNKVTSSNDKQIEAQETKNESKQIKSQSDNQQKIVSPKKTEEVKQKKVVKKETNRKTNLVKVKEELKISPKVKKEKPRVVKTQVASEQETIKIVNEVSGKTILSSKIDGAGKTVGDITTSILDKNGIEYKAQGSSGTIYFSMIAGLSERDAGPLSGWCYYVNGKKVGVGAGTYKLKAKDEVVWEYLKNGVNN